MLGKILEDDIFKYPYFPKKIMTDHLCILLPRKVLLCNSSKNNGEHRMEYPTLFYQQTERLLNSLYSYKHSPEYLELVSSNMLRLAPSAPQMSRVKQNLEHGIWEQSRP